MDLGLCCMVAQCSGSRPSKSLMSGFAPLSSSSSISERAPTDAARCIAVEPSELYNVEQNLINE